MGFRQHLRSARTLVRIALDNPYRAAELVEQRIEQRLGVDLHRFDPKRRRIRAFEQAHMRAPDASIRPFGNYYLDASRLPARPVVFSLGIGEHLDFDKAVAEAYPEARMFLFDPTPRSGRFFESAGMPGNVRFEPVAIAGHDGTITMFIDDLEECLESTTSVSVQAQSARQEGIALPCRSVPSLMREHGLDAIDVFKFDVEGAGILILNSLFNAGIWPTQIAGEFEGPLRAADVTGYLREVSALVEQMKARNYRLYHTRPDCPGWQVEFLAVASLESTTGGVRG
jgi:FkbM family methyltransferase